MPPLASRTSRYKASCMIPSGMTPGTCPVLERGRTKKFVTYATRKTFQKRNALVCARARGGGGGGRGGSFSVSGSRRVRPEQCAFLF